MILFRRKPTVNDSELARINAELDRLTPRVTKLAADNTQLFAELHKLRGYLADADATIAYQHGRMRDMAAQILGSQATIARYQKVAETWTAVDGALSPRGVVLDATVVLERVVA